MMRNNSPDPEMERRLRDHFAAEEPDLRAPEDMWDRLESQLGEQRPPRFTLLRGGAMTLWERPWLSAAAAAVLVAAIGIATWGLVADEAAVDDAEMAATAATTSQTTSSATTSSSSSTTTTMSAMAAPQSESDGATSDSAPSSTAAGLSDAVGDDDDEVVVITAMGTDNALLGTGTPSPVSPAVPSLPPVATASPPAASTPAPQATPAPSVVAVPAPTASPPRAVDYTEFNSRWRPGDSRAADTGDMADADDMADEDAMPMADSDGDADMDAENAIAEPEAEAEAEQAEPEDTTFQDYERTSFVDTSVDAVSTFSLDTDRTSYFLALNWARNGYTVDADSVRAEEWINAFDYGYSEPGDDRSFAITSDVLRHPLDTDLHLARIAFQAPEFRDDTPLNVTLVLDASGSMASGNRVAIAREAAETIRQSLSADDRIAVVHFSTDVLDRYTVGHSAPDDLDVVRSISRLAAYDTTNVQAGLDLGVELADAARRERPDAFNYIILMSDGVANVDATDPFAILESASDSDSSNPLRLITVGVGIENYNDVLLEQLAQHGNGWYRYLDDTTQARETFSRERWLALSTPFADQTRAQVTWDPAVVRSWRIVGYENRVTPDHTFEQNRKEFAELPAGAATTVFYELELWSNAGLPQALGSVEVRWVEPATAESRTQTAEVSGRTDVSFGAGDHLVRLGAIVGLAADRYSRLSTQVEGQTIDAAGVHADLATLQDELDAISGRLGSTEAYRDFDFLLDAITDAAEALAPSSGYSP